MNMRNGFFDYGVGYKVSFYNATIQGNIFNTNLAKPETQINHYIFTSHAGVQYSYKRFAATFSMQFNTGEFDRTKKPLLWKFKGIIQILECIFLLDWHILSYKCG